MVKKKVLFVVHQLNFGGVQKSILSVLNAIDYDCFDVTLYVRKNRLDLAAEINENVSQVIVNDDCQHYYRKPYSIWMMAVEKMLSVFGAKEKTQEVHQKLGRYIAEEKIRYEKTRFFSDGKKYDVAVSYIQGYPAKLVADCVNADRKIMFFHVSTDESHVLHESIFDRIDTIVGVNAEVQRVLEGLYPAWKEKMTYLTNYVDAQEVREKSQQFEIGAPKDRLILCTCGRLTAEKGFDLAVKSARILKESGEKFLWYFVGDGPERDKLEEMIRDYGLEDDIMITGMQSNPYPWMNACDIYVQPSREESYGRTMKEAMILGKPIVSTATVGGKHVLENGKLGVISEINGESLSRNIEKMLNDEDLRNYFSNVYTAERNQEERETYSQQINRMLAGEI